MRAESENATAVLTSSEPARETYARQPNPVNLAGTAEDVGVHLEITPGRPTRRWRMV